jgi:F0F1-type ATP synthase assembly protein I
MSLIYDARQMIKKLVIASTLIFPILLVALIYGWESIFAGSVIWLLIWFMLYGLCRGLWSLGKETNN